MKDIVEAGAHAVGGCCGTTPEYIQALIAEVEDIPFVPPVPKHKTVISSFSRTALIGDEAQPLIIGERINPTGKKRFKQALIDHDIDYIISQGLEQEKAGAHALDVNVGSPEVDEVELIQEVVGKLQSILPLPLQIDTSNVEAMEKALRMYNGKALINSVNGKEETMEAVFPLVKKYGGVVIGLALDENGIADTADGRVAVARKIYERAADYGIAKENVIIDGLCMTVSADPESALVTLETIRRIHDELGGNTILGVSNISFGLPARELINSYFFAMALQAGLSSAIINPNNKAMMQAYRTYCALSGKDTNFTNFITAYQNYETPDKRVQKAVDDYKRKVLSALDLDGADLSHIGTVKKETDTPSASATTKDKSYGNKLMEAVERGMAEAAKAAFAVVKEALADVPQETKGKVILATVKGDIHDIGKNIVKVLLENYGYQAVDLGRDVDPETIVETAVKEDIRLVGLSALMTTTVVNMEETIRLLREKKPDCKVIVGGAVMTKQYADSIGADCYGKDAMSTVRYADELLEQGLM